jgi:hypothetical protein
MPRTTFALLLMACGAPLPMDVAADSGTVVTPPPHMANAFLRACAQQARPVQSIEAAAQLINALGPDVSPACVLAAIPRPLSAVGTSSFISAQPALGKMNPRVLLLLPGLVVSFASSGDGAKLVEFGQWVSNTHTVKAELEFPLTLPLTSSSPYVNTAPMPRVSSCGFCHRDENALSGTPNAFASAAYQPEAKTLVTVKSMQALHEACIASTSEDARCDFFHALFDFGLVEQGAFAPEVQTFTR